MYTFESRRLRPEAPPKLTVTDSSRYRLSPVTFRNGYVSSRYRFSPVPDLGSPNCPHHLQIYTIVPENSEHTASWRPLPGAENFRHVESIFADRKSAPAVCSYHFHNWLTHALWFQFSAMKYPRKIRATTCLARLASPCYPFFELSP